MCSGPDAQHPPILFVFDGYGSLIEKLGEGLPVELEAEVDRIDWSGDGVVIRSSKGEFSSRSAIITVSTGVLASNQIEFEPALPAAWRAAIESLPMGNFVKVAIQFDRDVYDVFRDDSLVYLERPSTFIDIVTGLDDHRMAIAYIFGARAIEIEQMSVRDARDFILDRLEKVFGTGIREHVVGSLRTRWGADPHVRGSCASALPGRSDARAELAATLGARIIFAGEATSEAHYGFAHGAYLEGKAAAERVVAMLNG
jgi:monoamine oxidase